MGRGLGGRRTAENPRSLPSLSPPGSALWGHGLAEKHPEGGYIGEWAVGRLPPPQHSCLTLGTGHLMSSLSQELCVWLGLSLTPSPVSLSTALGRGAGGTGSEYPVF